MAGSRLIFEFQPRGLVVTGETFAVRRLLKDQGGRWERILSGWVFPHDAKAKLLGLLQAAEDAPPVEDRAQVTLTLEGSGRGPLVTGDTFPVKAFLRETGGKWDPKLRGWVFEDSQKGRLDRFGRTADHLRLLNAKKQNK